ncbi:MAG: S41 family peptidase [Rhizomicrobium sp.]
MTRGDLKAVHDTIAANHPGVVDPQNPGFKDWLEKGYAKALAVADQAKSFEDYQRALRLYKTGFRDGHVGVIFHLNPDTLSWPGFVLYGTKATNIQAVAAEPDAGVKAGDRLLGCDGQNVDALLAAHTDAYYWNADIPHLRYGAINRMFLRPQGWSITQPELDTRQQIKICQFSSGTVTLKWRGGDYADVLAKYDAALATPQEPKLRQIDGVWLLSAPTFYFPTDNGIAKMKAFIADVTAKAPDLRKGPLIIDVRGNGGGSSRWGDMIVSAIWGEPWLTYLGGKDVSYVEWRVSQANVKQIGWIMNFVRKQGGMTPDELKAYSAFRDQMATGVQQHAALLRQPDDAQSPPALPASNPVTGKVFFLTDRSCGSACLDFADRMHSLPGVTQIGLPTYADSVYLEANIVPLPSGIAELEYPMKVYRNRARGNNEWYEPKMRWPGGPMTDDDAIVRWVKTLN